MDWCGCFQLSGGNLFLKIGSKNLVWQGRMRVAPVQNRKFAEQLINFNNQVKTFFILKVRINFQQPSYLNVRNKQMGALWKTKTSKLMHIFFNILFLSCFLNIS